MLSPDEGMNCQMKTNMGLSKKKCCNTYHVVCRDRRGLVIKGSISNKIFQPKFRVISHHYGKDKNRWGNFVYICGNCSVYFSCTDNASTSVTDTANVNDEHSVSDVAIQCCYTITNGTDHEMPDLSFQFNSEKFQPYKRFC